MALEQDIANLVESTNQLTSVIDNKAKTIDAKMAQLDNRVAAKEAQVDQFIQDATPETRYVQTIKIGGSKDYLYPVWWSFPNNSFGTGKVTVHRHYSWNGGSSERPLHANQPHQSALLLELEGNASGWSGDANYLNIKRFSERYSNVASHVNFLMYCKAEKVNPDKPIYSGSTDGGFGAWYRSGSGLYLRGGGLTYRITKNWAGDVKYHDGSDNLRRVLREVEADAWSVRWFAEPIPFTDRLAPVAHTIPYVNHPYTPPAPASA